MQHVWLGKRVLFPIVALLSVNCRKPLLVQALSQVSAARPAVKSSIGRPEVVLGHEVVLRGNINNAEKIEINTVGHVISPIGTLAVHPGVCTFYFLTAKRKNTSPSLAITVNVISPLSLLTNGRNRLISDHELTRQQELADVYFAFDREPVESKREFGVGGSERAMLTTESMGALHSYPVGSQAVSIV
jgi:hypothetical protein